MNKIAYLSATLLFTCTVFFSCNNHEEELAQAKLDYEKLLNETQSKDSTLLSLVTTFNEVDENLQIIKEKEGIINNNMSGDGVPKDHRQRIMDDIQSIYSLMETNKAKIEELNQKLASARSQLGNSNKKLSAANKQLMEFEIMITNLNKQLEIKDQQIEALSNQLVKLNFALDSLGQEYKAKSELADEQDKELNTAYYVFDTKKGLLENEVIETKGGVIGIGKTKMLKKDFNKKYFTRIDVRETKAISLYANKASVLTNHPTESYSLVEKDGQVDQLLIKDPVAFWASSKYLVVLVE